MPIPRHRKVLPRRPGHNPQRHVRCALVQNLMPDQQIILLRLQPLPAEPLCKGHARKPQHAVDDFRGAILKIKDGRRGQRDLVIVDLLDRQMLSRARAGPKR